MIEEVAKIEFPRLLFLQVEDFDYTGFLFWLPADVVTNKGGCIVFSNRILYDESNLADPTFLITTSDQWLFKTDPQWIWNQLNHP